ncbi:UvrD-like helicase family protein [Melghirimyces profundicolus]|uniref:UvrD-like helicase family protein n=1 Tax=Melghirimyces profundicolus TaxID=1242148 RepID=A0A2T6C4T4_9BACL|nr:3'-5' exonuclease [Melghirimyces profundicolus]PTX63293.1 UvrD-like helicase family protein [Melghirimyces profundicolus]
MAHVIPETIRKDATAGERLLFRTLKEFLPEDYIVYHEPDIHGRRPDFVVIGPDLGLVVLEVKDYTRNTLVELNPDRWRIRKGAEGEISVTSPPKQAREYAFRIADKLKKDSELVHTGGKYAMQLKFPYGFGAVFTRLSRGDLKETGVEEVAGPERILGREEIDPEKDCFSAILLRRKLREMLPAPFPMEKPLTELDIARIRFHLFPEVRISGKVTPVRIRDSLLFYLENLETMDLHQEGLAKQIGDRHRLIRGVAGSGKTLILASRVHLLAKEHPDWNILVLCYNISLSRAIRRMVERKLRPSASKTEGEEDLASRVRVYNFHEWLREELNIRREEQIPEVLEQLNRGEGNLPRYDAALIDEGQDFQPEWLALVSKLLNPETQSLLLVEDRAQTIYSRRRSYKQDTGLDFRGRSRILTVNYRNTAPIVRFSWDFYQAHAEEGGKKGKGNDDVEIISPQSTLRKGPEPVVRRFSSIGEETDFVAGEIRRLRGTDRIPLSRMLILYRVKKFGPCRTIDAIRASLKQTGIPFTWIAENERSKRSFDLKEPTVKISTIDSSKGLDFDAVFVVNVDRLPFPLEENRNREASLLYIAMTRAKKHLYITYSGESEFTRYFDRFVSTETSHK